MWTKVWCVGLRLGLDLKEEERKLKGSGLGPK